MNKAIFPSFISLLILLIVFSIAFKQKVNIATNQSEQIEFEKIESPVLTASSSIVLMFTASTSKILYEHNADDELPIASITKLFTAYVSTTSEQFQPLLIESSNEAAMKITRPKTVATMNAFAKGAGLTHTTFFNTVGTDRPGPNISSASDVAKAVYSMYMTEHGKEIFSISTTVTPKATNRSLTDKRIPFEIVGGKTGETPKAGQTLTLITKGPNNSYLVFVVLGSKNRFEDMVILTNWAHDSFYPKQKDPLQKMNWVLATSTAAWGTRDAHSVVTFKDKMYLIGGINGNAVVDPNGMVRYWDAPHMSDIWVTDNGTNWSMVTDKAPWKNRRSVTTVVFNDKLWLMGGWSQYDNKYDNRIWFTEDGEQWTLATSTTPRWEGREGHTLNVHNGKMYLIGGVNFTKRITFNDVWSSVDGVDWKQETSNAPWTPRYDHAVSTFNNALYLTGGLHINTHDTESEVWVSTDGVQWEHRTPEWPSRHGHISYVYEGVLWITGGWDAIPDTGINDTWFTRDGKKWLKTKTNGPWTGREDHMGEIFKGKMWLTGGMDSNERWHSDVYYSSI